MFPVTPVSGSPIVTWTPVSKWGRLIMAKAIGPYLPERTADVTVPAMWAAVPILVASAAAYLFLGEYPDFSRDNARRAN